MYPAACFLGTFSFQDRRYIWHAPVDVSISSLQSKALFRVSRFLFEYLRPGEAIGPCLQDGDFNLAETSPFADRSPVHARIIRRKGRSSSTEGPRARMGSPRHPQWRQRPPRVRRPPQSGRGLCHPGCVRRLRHRSPSLSRHETGIGPFTSASPIRFAWRYAVPRRYLPRSCASRQFVCPSALASAGW